MLSLLLHRQKLRYKCIAIYIQDHFTLSTDIMKPWKIPEGISRRPMLFNLLMTKGSIYHIKLYIIIFSTNSKTKQNEINNTNKNCWLLTICWQPQCTRVFTLRLPTGVMIPVDNGYFQTFFSDKCKSSHRILIWVVCDVTNIAVLFCFIFFKYRH